MKIKIVGDKTKYINYDLVGKAVYKRLEQQEKLYAELILCSEEEIRQLNNDNRHIDAVTDVLSFPSLDGIRGKVIIKNDFPIEYDKKLGVFIGSIAICAKRAEEQAKEYGHSNCREFTFLTVHGLLHLMGYDHVEELDRKKMRVLEDEIMQDLNILD